MATAQLCKFYKDEADPNAADDTGYCDLDCDQTTCAGEIDSCPKSDSLKRYFFEQIRREGGFEWKRRMNTYISKDLEP